VFFNFAFMLETNKKSIILFDGLCNLCNSSVQFILKHDKKEQFLFASLQSDACTKVLLHLNYKKKDINSIVLIEGSKVFYKSTAALRILRELNPLWNGFYAFIIVPEFIRDFIYDLIANNRYKWFGKQITCPIQNVSHKNRFIT